MNEKPSGGGRRRHRSRAEAEQIAIEYESSGLSREEFSQRSGVPLKTLARDVTRHRTARDRVPKAQPLVAVEVKAGPRISSELVVLLADGLRIQVRRGFDATTLRELVQVLERR